MAQDLKQAAEWVKLAVENMAKGEKASKGIAESWTELSHQVKAAGGDIKSYLLETMKVPGFMKEVSRAIVTPGTTLRENLQHANDALSLHRHYLDEATRRLDSIPARWTRIRRAREEAENLPLLRANVQIMEQRQKMEEARLHLNESLHAVLGKNLAVEFLAIKGFQDAIKRSGELNQALIQANSNYDTRFSLTRQTYEVQARTGVSFQNMLAAAKELTMVGFDTRRSWKSTLDVMVEMEEGLGVSFESSAQLARIFEINLNTSVRGVADKIAAIANSTSLAADEATRFATEIGKALRLLGPGAAPQAKEVAGFVTMMAARMKDVGGDASEIVRMFGEMTKGTSQAFMLRGLAGVNRPGALGQEAGAQAAVQGIGRIIDRIVTAAPGTMQYAAQLEAASQMLGVSTETVRLYRDMLQKANEPLDERTRLEQRWREQVASANKALSRISDSFMALVQQAFVPILRFITPILEGFARFVSIIASSKTAITLTSIALGYAITKTVLALGRLTLSILEMAGAATVASRAGLVRSMLMGIPGSGLLRAALALLNPITKIAAAFAAGYAIGSIIDRFLVHSFPNMMQKLADKIASVFYKQPTAQLMAPTGTRQLWEVMTDVRRAMLQGDMKRAEEIFKKGAVEVKGMIREQGAQAYIDAFKQTSAEARERIGLSTVTSAEKATLENDRRMIEQTEQVIKNTGDAATLLKRVQQDRRDEQLKKTQAKTQEILNQQVLFHMTTDINMPTKFSLSR